MSKLIHLFWSNLIHLFLNTPWTPIFTKTSDPVIHLALFWTPFGINGLGDTVAENLTDSNENSSVNWYYADPRQIVGDRWKGRARHEKKLSLIRNEDYEIRQSKEKTTTIAPIPFSSLTNWMKRESKHGLDRPDKVIKRIIIYFQDLENRNIPSD
jgi:hypothetical protein